MNATGEWTTESVRDLVAAFGTISDVLPFGIIANAHNAALADQKRDLWEKISLSRIEADNWKGLYEKQTAALTAKDFERLCEQKNHKQELANQLTAAELKLAAEGAAAVYERGQRLRIERERNQLRSQLATLVDALKRCKQGFIALQDPQHANLIDTALAKVREVKMQQDDQFQSVEAYVREMAEVIVETAQANQPVPPRTFVVDWNWTNQQCGEELMKFLKSKDMAEVTVESGFTDERCPRCGSRICLDYYCEAHGHAQPVKNHGN